MNERFGGLLSLIVDFLKQVWGTVCGAFKKYDEIDGEQRASAFAYYAFFALFPLIILFVSLGAQFLKDGTQVADAIIGFLREYMPLGLEQQEMILDTIQNVINSRGGAGIMALLGVAWSSLRFFQALVRGVNRAWGTHEYSWWRLPIKNLAMVGILASALLVGVLAPAVIAAIQAYWQTYGMPMAFGMVNLVFDIVGKLIPALVLFYGIILFYKWAPRGGVSFRQVWVASLVATFALQILQKLFVVYATQLSNFKSVYGAFGGIIALLMWIYLSGSILIFGACLSAVQHERRMQKKTEPAAA